jgi:hypothetical protein
MYNRSIFLESGKKIRGDNQNVLSVIKIAFHQARLSPDYVDTQGTSTEWIPVFLICFGQFELLIHV